MRAGEPPPPQLVRASRRHRSFCRTAFHPARAPSSPRTPASLVCVCVCPLGAALPRAGLSISPQGASPCESAGGALAELPTHALVTAVCSSSTKGRGCWGWWRRRRQRQRRHGSTPRARGPPPMASAGGRAAEAAVGITCFANSSAGFTGILKHRWQGAGRGVAAGRPSHPQPLTRRAWVWAPPPPPPSHQVHRLQGARDQPQG